MRRFAVAFTLLTLLLPLPANAQLLDWLGDGDGEGAGSGSSASLVLDVTMDTNIDAPFFARTPLGFGLETVETLWLDSVRLGERFVAWSGQESGGVPTWVFACLALVAFFGGAFLFWFVDQRARRFAHALADRVTPLGEAPSVATRAKRHVISAGSTLVVPVAALGLSFFPLAGLFPEADWAKALSYALGVFVVYRAVVAIIEGLLGQEGMDADDATRGRLMRVLIVMGRAIMIFAIIAQAAPAFDYRQDVEALALTLFRVSWFVCSVLLWRSRKDIVALLPNEGSSAYLRARAALASAVSYATAYFSVLFGFWAAGFDRAASALLVRSYGLVALIVVGALVQRWFDRVAERQVSEPKSLRQALEGSVDGFTRMAFYAAYAWAFLWVLSLSAPLKALLAAFRIEVGSRPISLLGLVSGLVIMAAAVLISRLYRAVADHWMYPALNVEMGAGYAVDTAVHYFLMVIAFGLALVSLGIDLAALTVFMGALGVGIGFGLQDMARNFAAGFVLLFGRAVQKGDIITAGGDHYGRVEEIGARVVKVRTRDNFDLLIPSNELVNSTIINWTHENPYVRLHIDVGVGYGSDVDEVEKALLRAARQWEYTSSFNPPEVWFIEFGDNALLFQLLLWVDATRIDPNRARGRIYFPIWRELAERGIEIPFPQRDLHIRTVSEEAGAALQGSRSGPATASPEESSSEPTIADD